jgi:predicted metal-binding membrane protein
MSVAHSGTASRDAWRVRPVPALLACSAAAWVALMAVSASPWSGALEHTALENLGEHPWAIASLTAGWVLMIAAMMLPTSVPMLALFARLTAARPDQRELMAILVGVYMLVWTGTGVAMHVADFGLHRLVDHWRWLAENSWVISASTLALAGAYQLSPPKERCAARCRTPQGFIRAHWHGGAARADTWRLALAHASYCVGCCWALMLVMFSVGVGSLAWMLALTAVMAAEKTPKLGHRMRAPVGIWLLAGALATVISA